jgi:outer membrane protein
MKILLSILSFTLLLNASNTTDSLTLDEALEILQTKNLEIKAAKLDIEAAVNEADTVSGMNWGSLDFTQDFARSNDAGNVFGFKLSSREASFGDFGFNEFLSQMGSIGTPAGQAALLATQPNDLNYPDDRNYFQSKLKYQVPLFTGFAISSYSEIMNSMTKMKTLEKEQVTSEKIYQLRKSYYDMALLNDSIINLEKILENISTLENVTSDMITEGYAKKSIFLK